MKEVTFGKLPVLARFRTKNGIHGMKILPDCVVGIQFLVNAVRSAGVKKGKLFFVKPRSKVFTRG